VATEQASGLLVHYLRGDTIAAANAALIAAQSQVPIVAAWGKGLLASVDGLRFVVPVRTINAGASPKYYGYKRGITWLNAVNDQVAGIVAMVVPGTPRDSLFILDTLLNLDGGVKPGDGRHRQRLVLRHGLRRVQDCRLQLFAPLRRPGRPAVLAGGDARQAVRRLRPLEVIARNKVITRWPDMLWAAGSLVTSQVRACDPGADVRPRGPPDPAGAGVRRVRAEMDRQDVAPPRRGRPGR